MLLDPIVRTINNLMQMRGGPVDLVVSSNGTYDPATSTVITTDKKVTLRGLVFDAKESISPNSLIQTGDKQVFLKPLPGMPVPEPMKAEIVYGGVGYKVIVVKEMNPTGSNVMLYEIIARR